MPAATLGSQVDDMFNYHKLEDDQLEYIAVASVDEIQDGERLIVDIGYETVALFKVAGKYYAIADVCSHDDGPVAEGELEGEEIECPRHGAHFDLRTGKALSLPAVADIPAYPVRIEGDEILVGLPLEQD
jgi:3-phenylpropionate/trans-cinnamate dioxygenase ferredoxin subunit